MLRFKVMA